MNRFVVFMIACALATGLASSSADAQEMGQGHAHITTRSDVRMSLESVPGTGAARLAALGRAAGAGMGAIRECYGRVVEERPTVTGTVRLRVSLPERGRPDVNVEQDGARDRALVDCVRGVLTRQSMDGIERPAAAIVVLEFQNTAAAGAAETARRADEADEVAVTREGERAVARGDAPGIRFLVRGREDAQVAEGLRVVRSQIAGMLDCRRRASRRGMDPTGTVALTMQMRARHAPEMTPGRSTVRDERAPVCLERALESAPRTPEAGARLEVEVEFLPGE
ncbi:hypothetical protein [Sandaracinus amylolyticus]|uniref:hypothetical protein n=1 Tax=Sandaracinus amylolyticus TaxID=927083 RepID=UPI001F3ACAB9|nr:hypothetical protein [Sandaracinus amylolyticus]UJR79321.1 Hypothetical protein I5071_13570 [Sandaracinus amylolyticus]